MNDYNYNPDYWQVVKITQPTGESVYKLFSTWVGGYAKGDSWKLNSGITKIVEESPYLEIHGVSGSVYRVPNRPEVYRTNMYTQSVLDHFQREMANAGGSLETVPFASVKTEIKDYHRAEELAKNWDHYSGLPAVDDYDYIPEGDKSGC